MLESLSRCAKYAAPWLLSLAAMLAATATAADAEDCPLPSEVESVLTQFYAARSHYAYRGTLLLEHDSQRQFLNLESTPGQGVSLHRLNASDPGAPERLGVTLPSSATDICGLGNSYIASLSAGPTVAARSTQRLKMQPRDPLRFGYVMDLDEATGLALRVITATAEGQIIELYEFADIDILAAEPVVSGAREPSATADSVNFVLSRLPTGYSVIEQHPLRNQIVVSDGLASASIFLEPLPQDFDSGEGSVRHGSTITYTRGVRDATGGWLATVIGEVPVNAARLLVSGVRMASTATSSPP